MTAEERTRGQPLLVFAVILGVWLVGRVLLWVPPFAMPPLPASPFAQNAGGGAVTLAHRGGPAIQGSSSRRAAGADAALDFPSWFAGALAPPRLTRSFLIKADVRSIGAAPRRAAGHQMLLAAAFANGPTLRDLAGSRRDAPQPVFAFASPPAADGPLLGSPREPVQSASLLSGDAWLYWRDGSADAVAPGVSSYGRSQAGAVMRYRLLPRHALRPAAYVRVTRTLEGARQEEVAAGVSLRPLPQIPVTVAAEARVTDSAAGREVRPAAFAVTQLPPLSLPLGMRGEAYVQAGYVGGRFKTGFVDGQARLDRRLVRLGEDEEIRVGLGTWGGAQRGTARLDAGPTASIAFKLGDASARIAADYRFRVAGDAAPASGPAVTFSAGF